MAIGDKLKVTRDQLAEFIESHNTIRQFERLFEYINTFVIEQASLPEIYDISAADTVIVLPSITGGVQRSSYYWTGGDGSNTISFTGLDGYIGEGEGNIEIESDGTDWQVAEYSDYLTDGVNQKIWKEKDGTEKQLINNPITDAINTATAAIFRSAQTSAVTRFHTYVTIDSENMFFNEAADSVMWIVTSVTNPTITETRTGFMASQSSKASDDHILSYSSTGRWKI